MSCACRSTCVILLPPSGLNAARGWAFREELGDVAMQVPRADISAADEAANRVRDYGSFKKKNADDLGCLVRRCVAHPRDSNIGFLISFDGANRGNPGHASF